MHVRCTEDSSGSSPRNGRATEAQAGRPGWRKRRGVGRPSGPRRHSAPRRGSRPVGVPPGAPLRFAPGYRSAALLGLAAGGSSSLGTALTQSDHAASALFGCFLAVQACYVPARLGGPSGRLLLPPSRPAGLGFRSARSAGRRSAGVPRVPYAHETDRACDCGCRNKNRINGNRAHYSFFSRQITSLAQVEPDMAMGIWRSTRTNVALPGERVMMDVSYHQLAKISLSWAINCGFWF